MVSASTRWLPWTRMELTVAVWAWATGAVSDTTPMLNEIPPRTRQATPSPRTSHLQSFIRHAPFVVPFGLPPGPGSPRERSSLSPEGPHRRRRRCRLFPVAQTSPSPALPLVHPEKLHPSYDAVHWAARCK